MARVTIAEVKEIVAIAAAITDPQINAFITVANLTTNRVNTVGGITDASLLKEIERWLSAHFVRIRDIAAASEKAGPVAQSFQYKVDLNFNQTQYGQQALILDYSGTLAALQKQAEDGTAATTTFNVIAPELS